MTIFPHEVGLPTRAPLPRIFVVIEEDNDLRELVTSYLQSRGGFVLALKEPPARDDLFRLRPDVLILDLIYQGEPIGFGLLNHDYRGIDSTVVVLTAASELVALWQHELEQVADRVILKPFELDDFDAAVGFLPESSPLPLDCKLIVLDTTGDDERRRQ
jgi:DNA-binding response OmpR family regulator